MGIVKGWLWTDTHGRYIIAANSYYLFWAESGLWDYALALHLDRFMRGWVIYGVSLWSGSSLIEQASSRWWMYIRMVRVASLWGPTKGHPVLWLTYAGLLGLAVACALVWWISVGIY